jgi:hypothetical protein
MHGRDEAARRAIFDLLRRLGLHPLEWDELVDRTGTAAPYNAQAVAAAFKETQAVVVVITPDDVGFLHPALRGPQEREDDREPTGQPRLNVVLEAGMALQSHPQRTVLVEIGRTRAISDLAGINTIRLDGSPAKLNSLASRLESAGCPVERKRSDWLDPVPFERLDAHTRDAPGRVEADSPAGAAQATLHARHMSVELATAAGIVESALNNGHWWNVAVEVLPSHEWAAGRDVLAHHAGALYDVVAKAYVDADLMTKAALNAAQGGHDEYDERTRERLEQLQRSISAARGAIQEYMGANSPNRENDNHSTDVALAQIEALLQDLPERGYCPIHIAEMYRALRAKVAEVSPTAATVVSRTPAADELLSSGRHTATTCEEIRVALGQMRATLRA